MRIETPRKRRRRRAVEAPFPKQWQTLLETDMADWRWLDDDERDHLECLIKGFLFDKRFELRKIRPDLLWLMLISMGFGVYLWVNLDVYGTPFAFLEMSRIQMHKVLSAPWVGAQLAVLS